MHVNCAHLDFLTPESDDLQYLEVTSRCCSDISTLPQGGGEDYGSLWQLDRCAGEEEGLAGGGMGESPGEGRSKGEGRSNGEGRNAGERSSLGEGQGGERSPSPEGEGRSRASPNPFIDSEEEESEADTTVSGRECSVQWLEVNSVQWPGVK